MNADEKNLINEIALVSAKIAHRDGTPAEELDQKFIDEADMHHNWRHIIDEAGMLKKCHGVYRKLEALHIARIKSGMSEKKFYRNGLDLIRVIRKHTGFSDLFDMVSAAPEYRPLLNTSRKGAAGRELTKIADAYDAAMAERGDARRARRW